MVVFHEEDRGVSPVIGVILLVGLTVSLSVLATYVIFDVGDNFISESASAEAKIVEKQGMMQATIISNENVEQFRFVGPNGRQKTLSNVGDTATLMDGNGAYDLIGESESGTETMIIQSVGETVFDSSALNTLNITVENSTDNTIIQDATVEVYDIINTTNTTGSATFDLEDGSYSLNVNDEEYKSKTEDVTVSGDTSQTITLDPKDTTVTGTVSTNPNIQGATVVATLNDGTTIETTTDVDGKYSFSEAPSNIQSITVNANGEDKVDGNDFYASAKRNISSSQFKSDFTFTNRVYKTVNGETIAASYEISEDSVTEDKMIGNVHQLQLMQADLSANYKIIRDIDASNTDTWENGKGFDPIGDSTSKFTGSLEGSNKTISSLYIKRNATDYVGLFGYTDSGSQIKNLSISNGNISGYNEVGGLVGRNDGGEFDSINYEGQVASNSGNIVGGIIGRNTNNYRYNDLVFTGRLNATGGNNIGGLIGKNTGGDITESYVEATVIGNKNVGGIIGSDLQGNHDFAFKTGKTKGSSDNVGSIIGDMSDTEVTYVYSNGTVTGNNNVSGLIGTMDSSSSMNYTYTATDTTGGSTNVGSVVGYNKGGEINVSYWNKGLSSSDTGTTTGTETNIKKLSGSKMQGDTAEPNMNNFEFGSGGKWDEVNETDDDAAQDYYPVLIAIDRQEQINAFGVG